VSVRVLGAADVHRLLPFSDCIEAVAEGLVALHRGDVHNPLRAVIRSPGATTLLGLMPAYRGGERPLYGLKTVVIAPANPALGLDAHQGFVALLDGTTGVLRALVNASAVTAIRTAATSAVATRALARPGARTVAVLGAGVQARAHIEALRVVLADPEVRVWARQSEAARTLAEAEGAEPAASVERAVGDADVVVTATAAAEPILSRRWLAEGAHVNAVGSSIPTTRELDTATVASAALFVDRRESALNEAGDLLFPLREGAIGPDAIRAELGEVLAGAADGRRSAAELTVFKSLGLAVEDLVAAELVLRRAERAGAGQEVDL
jgi:ornithine cyclodeaminase